MKKGIITKTLGGFFFVADKEHRVHKTNIRGRIQKTVYPGDRVCFSPTEEIIEEVMDRKTFLSRPSIANVEQVLVIQSLRQPHYDRTLLDRFLLLIEAVGLQAIVVINKIDLVRRDEWQDSFIDYQRAGYPLFFISAQTGENIQALKEQLVDKITVTAGPSGTGKTSLINTLISGLKLPVKPVSKKSQRGVHTTRHVELLPLETGGWIADTPGFTSLKLEGIEERELPYLFPEFLDYENDCQFRSCCHIHEPGCAVKEAVECGDISRQRYQSYQNFYDEVVK